MDVTKEQYDEITNDVKTLKMMVQDLQDIVEDSIGNVNLLANSIATGNIQDNAITSDKIFDGAITVLKLDIDLDDISDGTSYGRVAATSISGGTIIVAGLDSGVTARVVSTLLTWRQETKYPVMLVATANDVAALPSMVYRKGRLDEVWATDLPSLEEREEIFKIHLRKRKRDPEKFGCAALAEKAEEFTGSEIESCIEDAMFSAFDQGVEVTPPHVLRAIRDTIPQARRDKEEVSAIREWVSTRARLVSGGDRKPVTKSKVRQLKTKKK